MIYYEALVATPAQQDPPEQMVFQVAMELASAEVQAQSDRLAHQVLEVTLVKVVSPVLRDHVVRWDWWDRADPLGQLDSLAQTVNPVQMGTTDHPVLRVLKDCRVEWVLWDPPVIPALQDNRAIQAIVDVLVIKDLPDRLVSQVLRGKMEPLGNPGALDPQVVLVQQVRPARQVRLGRLHN
jgi:hypothetical protein